MTLLKRSYQPWGPPYAGLSFLCVREKLGKMLGDELRHLKHIDGLFAAEHRLESGISIDVPLVRRILQVILFDINPQLLDYFRPGQGPRADYFS